MVRDGYKMTKLGEILDEWDVATLRAVSHIQMEQSPPSSSYNASEQGLPFFQGNAYFGEKHPRQAVPKLHILRNFYLVF